MNLLIVGAPGTGKGTMSEKIVERYGVTHVSTGDMLRSAIASGTEVGKAADGYMSKGMLVPDNIIHDVIVEWLSNSDLSKGFLFDGYPRTYTQALEFDQISKDLGIELDAVVDLCVDEEALKTRITGRRVCPNCKSIYHIVTKAPKVEGVCDVCSSLLIQRKDDTIKSLETRLSEYHRNTEPVIRFYEEKGLLKKVDAGQKPEKVFEDITTVLGAL